MKKIAVGFIVLTLVSVSFADDLATINLSGNVDAVSSIQIENGASTDVTIDILDGSNKSLQAQEISNANAGYTIKGRSTNGGMLHGSSNLNYSYTLKYAGTDLNLGSETILKKVTGLSMKTSVQSDISIHFEARPDAPSGSYSDTVTLTIESN